jgi:hypothetical protein
LVIWALLLGSLNTLSNTNQNNIMINKQRKIFVMIKRFII